MRVVGPAAADVVLVWAGWEARVQTVVAMCDVGALTPGASSLKLATLETKQQHGRLPSFRAVMSRRWLRC
eukprot:1071838-Rhodomonas_salina.6